MQTYSQSGAVTPQQLGFQPLGAAASGAPPPMLMPGQTGYQQQPYGYSVGYPSQQYPQQQFPQQPYPPQYAQQYAVQFPTSQPYGGPQYPQGPYSAPMYNQAPAMYNQAAPMYNQAAPMYNQAAPMYNQAAPMYNQAAPAYGYAQPGAVGYQGQPQSQGFNMGSGLMGFGAGAVTGAALDHMFTGRKNNSHGGSYGGGGHQHGHH